jgi:ketosteroid isomerase-like protein
VSSTSDNRRLAAEFFGCFASGDVDGAMARMADDVIWRVAAAAKTPGAGGMDKKRIAGMFRYMIGELKDGKLSYHAKDSHADGDKVAIELEGSGELKSGRAFNSKYHLLMTFRDGKVCAVREFLDRQDMIANWFGK